MGVRRTTHPQGCFTEPVFLSQPLESFPFTKTYRSPTWSSRRHAKGSFLVSRNRLVQPGPSGRFFTSAIRQAVAAIARFTVIGCHRLVK